MYYLFQYSSRIFSKRFFRVNITKCKDEAVVKGKGRVSDAWSDGADADFANDIAADDDGSCVFLVFFELPWELLAPDFSEDSSLSRFDCERSFRDAIVFERVGIVVW